MTAAALVSKASQKRRACCCRCVPSAIARNHIGGYVLIIVAAMGVWAPHGPFWSW